MKAPVFVKGKSDGNLLVFRTVADAERYLEIYDIKEEGMFCCDSMGGPALLRGDPKVLGRIQMIPSAEDTSCAAALRRYISRDLRWLRRIGKWSCAEGWLTAAPLEDLVAEISKFALR